MKTPETLAAQMAEKASDQLVEMLKRPDQWLPLALEMARAELQRRGFDPSTVSPLPPPAATRHLFKLRSWPETLITIWLVIVALAVGLSCVVSGYQVISWWASFCGFCGAGIATSVVAGLYLLDLVRFQSCRRAYALAGLAAACIASVIIAVAATWLADAIAPGRIPAGMGMLFLFAMVVMFWIVVAVFVLFAVCMVFVKRI